jgi:hypothetical protein
LVGCGDGPDQGSDCCGRHAEGTGDLFWVRLFWSEPKALLMPAFEVAG